MRLTLTAPGSVFLPANRDTLPAEVRGHVFPGFYFRGSWLGSQNMWFQNAPDVTTLAHTIRKSELPEAER